jgi:hypothetical protein
MAHVSDSSYVASWYNDVAPIFERFTEDREGLSTVALIMCNAAETRRIKYGKVFSQLAIGSFPSESFLKNRYTQRPSASKTYLGSKSTLVDDNNICYPFKNC